MTSYCDLDSCGSEINHREQKHVVCGCGVFCSTDCWEAFHDMSWAERDYHVQ